MTIREIDAVITWVDGTEDKHKKALSKSIRDENLSKSPNVISSRYEPSGEIKYCVLSILKYAPFIRKIFIVSDQQRPPVEALVEKHYPFRLDDVVFVDHQEIFEGFLEYLPVFNSRAIETMLWRIKGLSDHFIYFNDDFFIVKPISLQDFYQKDQMILRCTKEPKPWLRLLWHEVLVPKSKRRASYHLGQWNGARVAGFTTHYYVFEHTPYLLSKRDLEVFFQKHPEKLISNISFKFRSPEQYNPCALSYHLCIQKKKAISQSKANLTYLQPKGRADNYIMDKVLKTEKSREIKFMCVQDLSISSSVQRKEIFTWLENLLI